MDTVYAQTVRLLLTAAPDVFANDIFALKGGTAINLFVQNMPRLSVDLDVVYLPWATPRDEALQTIADELDAIARRLEKLDLRSRRITSRGLGDTKLIVEDDQNQLKIEVNIVFRGTVLPAERRAIVTLVHEREEYDDGVLQKTRPLSFSVAGTDPAIVAPLGYNLESSSMTI